jgi:energy-coupling factor transporter ATP-binding protein EcfA2
LLIDEVEMALHPQAQVRLLRKVIEIASAKNLTVLFSTHSATLIKNVDRKKLIHMKADNSGFVSTIKEVFPAQILGEIAFDDELAADFIFYVEDKQAKLLAEQMFAMYMAHCHLDSNYRPLYKVVPVGGFVQVIEMLNSSSSIFPNHVKKFALLDEDVKTESLNMAQRERNQTLINLFNSASGRYYFLPCTPEVGLIELFENQAANNTDLMNQLNSMFSGHLINIASLTSEPDYLLLTKQNVRDRAKDRLTNIVKKVCAATNNDEIHVRRAMYNEYCKEKYSNNTGQLRSLLGPIFNSR